MNEREKKILSLIQKDPYISQQEIADKLSLSRSAVAGYISSLMKSGEIVGKAYVLKQSDKILCIGGANVDRKICLKDSLHWHTSNPVKTHQSIGGVARNIAETLGILGADVSLLSAIGEDVEGKEIVKQTYQTVDMSPTVKIHNEKTGSYSAILDDKGEMIVAFADMDIYDRAVPELIEDKWAHIRTANLIVVDTNFPQETLEEIITYAKNEERLLGIVGVSVSKMERLPNDLRGVNYLICNEGELQALAGARSNSQRELAMIAMEKGVEHVVVTEGEKGVTCFSKSAMQGHIPAVRAEVVDVTGAGDAFSAAFFYRIQEGSSVEEAAKFGLAAASLTVESKQSVNRDLSVTRVEERMNER